MRSDSVDYRDVQGLLRFGYKHLKGARFVMLRVKRSSAAQTWLRGAPVTTAETLQPPPPEALHLAFTPAGLEALGVPAAIRAEFSPEFLGGMADPNRARRLGDVGVNAPANWTWGGGANAPHVLAMFFTRAVGDVQDFFARARGPAFEDAFTIQHVLDTSDQDGVEPFGFADGLSQPSIDWNQESEPDARKLRYSNVAALGEFVLGYRNEYGKFTDRPLVDAEASSTELPSAIDVPGKKDVGRNGTYLVIRQLAQDVRAFWQFVHRAAGGDPAAMDRLSSAFVGRERNGRPLVFGAGPAITTAAPRDDQTRLNQFTFDEDPRGIICPMGAHIRRSNPRNTDFPGHPTGLKKLLAALGGSSKGFRDDLISAVRFHRLLRRGREYGPGLAPADALQPAPPGDPERGLHFICLNANIGRQFEFLQNAWLVSATFADLQGESDPMVGNRQAIPGCPYTDGFTLPRKDGPAERVNGLPQFVTTRGGEYFFLPGIRALRYLASFPA